ncbi:hypothetical protein KSI01_09440 [Kurthia sibirica]|nr:hypothetical protein KSI01_09440 [Kurthia sibirica]
MYAQLGKSIILHTQKPVSRGTPALLIVQNNHAIFLLLKNEFLKYMIHFYSLIGSSADSSTSCKLSVELCK